MQHEITEKHNVFEENGEVMCAGWARTPVFEYNSEQSKTSGKHSERDCYFISNTEVSLYLSVENLGMEFAVKIAVADLKRGGVIYDCVVKKFVFSKNELPESGSSGELLYTARGCSYHMQYRTFISQPARYVAYERGKDLSTSLSLTIWSSALHTWHTGLCVEGVPL